MLFAAASQDIDTDKQTKVSYTKVIHKLHVKFLKQIRMCKRQDMSIKG